MPTKQERRNCNERCVRETALKTGESTKLIEEVISFNNAYISNIISSGVLDNVMIPYFGKFSVKLPNLHKRNKIYASKP